ncbi:helix-turn-helix transcriptional regulator [Trichococcus collinsii]|uniref:Helix-turn-helix n=1 Tax=Trichococcus collinsii TaxID=157076 RepID=A0AB37ZXU5_9LACT|nr:helix-turn-helix transcriptional regulator [Trichococcus collinsii]CZR03673.1 Hypothetical protein Tcol_2186 [Trichococcus collinsii]SEA00910.1 Helix-turn-helix [Trichococcus collinsii]
MQSRLYAMRKDKLRMTQEEIAKYLGISTLSYRNKEKGKSEFTQDEMFALSKLLDKSIDSIFFPKKHQNGDKREEQ